MAVLLVGAGSPQDAVESVVRDRVARGHRTGRRVRRLGEPLRDADGAPQPPQG
ncbi:DUF2191 domain-containing protein [Streptomyces subrutilus]|uniref:DUF2191 domain-containing protein n=1 Tax=Streptomyces subrutilus TaxID=36818 RepID=UPI0034338CB4